MTDFSLWKSPDDEANISCILPCYREAHCTAGTVEYSNRVPTIEPIVHVRAKKFGLPRTNNLRTIYVPKFSRSHSAWVSRGAGIKNYVLVRAPTVSSDDRNDGGIWYR